MIVDREHIVVGLGGIGSAALYWLARRGAQVLGLEQFAIGHERGASHDHSRIIRRSYHSRAYVELTAAAYDAWAALEEDSGDELVIRTGGLDLWPPDAALPMSDYIESLDACGVGYELLDADEVVRRWPQWRLDGGVTGLYQEDGGIVAARRCNAAHLRRARAHGAEVRDNTLVSDLRTVDGAVELTAGGERLSCRRLLLTPDAWTNELLEGLGAHVPLTVTQEQVVYWSPDDLGAFAPERFPIWIWNDEPSFYGFPAFGEPGVKAGQDVGGREVTARTRTFEADTDALERLERFMRAHLPTALGRRLYVKSCLYTMPPDRDLVIGTLPGHDEVLIALGAAHGFKFASLLGRILAELALDGATTHDLEPFRTDRPALEPARTDGARR
jgi:sarcosine oxidase